MNKTKVRISPLLLDYRERMGERVNEARDKKLRVAAQAEVIQEPLPFVDIPAPRKAGLLPPPRIETLDATIFFRDGQTEIFIQINTVDVFGIEGIYVTLRDAAGNLLDSGYAIRVEVCETHWGYYPSVALAAGTSVILRAVAIDAMGGTGIGYETFLVYDSHQQRNDAGETA